MVLAPIRQSPASRPISVQVCRMQGMILASAVHRNSRMLKKSASIRGPLFGLSRLSSLSGFWLDETNQMSQINQTNKTNQMNQIDSSRLSRVHRFSHSLIEC